MKLRRCKRNPTIRLEVESEIKAKSNERNLARTFDLFAVSEKNPINQIKGKRTGTHVAIDILDNRMRNLPYLIKVPQLLQKHFKFMHNLGILLNKYDGDILSGSAYILKKAFFWIFSTLTVIDSVKLIKYFSIGYLHEGDLFKYTTLLYVFLNAFIRLYFLYMLVCDQAKIVSIQKTIKAMIDSLENVVNQDYTTTNQELCFLVYIWTLALVGPFVLVMFGNATLSSGWSFGDTIKMKTLKISEILFVWTTNSTEAYRAQAALYDKYVDNWSYMSLFLGISCTILEFFGYILDSAVDDLFLLIATTVYKLMSDFKFETILQNNFKTHSELAWRHYSMLQNISRDIDLAFGSFLKIAHLRNLIRCGYYLLMLTGDESFDVECIIFTLEMLKIVATYSVAAKASSTNKNFRKWIQRTYREQTCIVVGSKHLNTSLIVDELATNPIGLGSGNFHIDESFTIKVVIIISQFV
ncbi:unnamed protein product [Orchesella dallaii]|uniref:Gustatory receptor n=1 Tax=Orchesella dallaii TaxID=48710 RepID=A0ABP1PPD0_9HEXA